MSILQKLLRKQSERSAYGWSLALCDQIEGGCDLIMVKNDICSKSKPSAPIQFIEREFFIDGKRVRAFFPQKPDAKTMSLIKNMLLDAHIKNAGTH